MNTPLPARDLPHLATGTYTPGYAGCKLLMVGIGLAVCISGLIQLWTPLRLTLFGKSAQAEAVCVVKTKPGLPDAILRTDAEIERQREPQDLSYVFWNEFTFHPEGGAAVQVRAKVGSHVGPLYSLLDADGLPTTALLFYNPSKPEQTIFPLITSTWLAAAVIALGGLACAVIGAVLLYWANKPIELPYIPTIAEIEALEDAPKTDPAPEEKTGKL